MRGVRLALASAFILASCGSSPTPLSTTPDTTQGVLCNASRDLVASINRTTQAAAAGAGTSLSEQLARQARSLAEQSHDRLQSITADVIRRSTGWQALLSAYLHAGQAANALLPEYNAPAVTAGELRSARSALDEAAHAGLDPECFLPSSSTE